MFDGTGRLCTPRPLVVLKSVTKAVTFLEMHLKSSKKMMIIIRRRRRRIRIQ
jgi:hypothetical protein